MYGIAKKKVSSDSDSRLFVARLSNKGEIKDNTRVHEGRGLGWVKEYKSKEAAQKDLDKMLSYGYDDYEIVDLEPLRNDRSNLKWV